MRTYYVFNINLQMSILAKDMPYILYKNLESIHKSNDIYLASSLYEGLVSKINKNIINNILLNNFKDNDFYLYNNNHHSYYNKYKDESCEIDVKNSYLIYKSNSKKLVLLNKLREYNLFVCDFFNKDYFWLSEICC